MRTDLGSPIAASWETEDDVGGEGEDGNRLEGEHGYCRRRGGSVEREV
jgi:hypothetical protein